jgi:hypothetical protein
VITKAQGLKMNTNTEITIQQRIEKVRQESLEITNALNEGIDYTTPKAGSVANEKKILTKSGAELIAKIMGFSCESVLREVESHVLDEKRQTIMYISCKVSNKSGDTALGNGSCLLIEGEEGAASQEAYTAALIRAVISLAVISDSFIQADDIKPKPTILGNPLIASNTKPNDGYNPELVFM